MEIPAGALAADTDITIETPPVDLVPETPLPLALARIYGPSGLVFNSPATIRFHYTDAQVEGFDESSLTLNIFNEITSSWEALATTVDSTTNVLMAEVDHFSTVAVFGELSVAAVPSLSEWATIALVLTMLSTSFWVITNKGKSGLSRP